MDIDGFLVNMKPEQDRPAARADIEKWLSVYADRVLSADERAAWEAFTVSETERDLEAYGPTVKHGEHWLAKRETETRRWNPRFVLRQWVLEETIGELEERKDIKERRAVLAKVLDVRHYSSMGCLLTLNRWRQDHSSPGVKMMC